MDDDLLAPVELERPDAGTSIPPVMRAGAQRAGSAQPERAAEQRELERARRAEAARVAALVRFMLHDRGDAPRR